MDKFFNLLMEYFFLPKKYCQVEILALEGLVNIFVTSGIDYHTHILAFLIYSSSKRQQPKS